MRADPAAFADVRAALERMRDLSSAEPVDLLAMGKAYAALSRAMCEATRASGQSSVRFDAAAKALELTTKKSDLAAFVGE